MAIAGICKNSQTPLKNSKAKPLTKEEKEGTQEISQVTIAVEHVICCPKRFKIYPTSMQNSKKKTL
jgi:hypothetical protein